MVGDPGAEARQGPQGPRLPEAQRPLGRLHQELGPPLGGLLGQRGHERPGACELLVGGLAPGAVGEVRAHLALVSVVELLVEVVEEAIFHVSLHQTPTVPGTAGAPAVSAAVIPRWARKRLRPSRA